MPPLSEEEHNLRSRIRTQHDLESNPVGEKTVRIHMLGGFRVWVGPRVIDEREWQLRKAANLIKLLALAENHRLHRERVTELLWPHFDRKAAANNLYHVLHVARHVLEEEAATSTYLCLQDERLELCPEVTLWVDVEAFEDAAATAHRSREPAAYRAAIGLYTGDLLPNDRYETWTEERREGLRLTYLALLTELAYLYEELGDFKAAIEALQRAVATEPAHEEAHVSLMLLYAKAGHRYQALRQYEGLRQALRRGPATEPHVTSRHVYEEILAGRIPTVGSPSASSSPAMDAPQAAGTHNLPGSLTSFVGRERELVEVKQLLGTVRLLTVAGTGGSGKTRLALEVAKDLVGAYPDGVWLVELAPLSEGALVSQAVAKTLGVREHPNLPLVDTIVEALRRKNTLLVLDNCEHLVDPVARLVETLLRSCPGLRVLATSREVLGAAGEVTWPVPSLSGPEDLQHQHTVEELAGYESVQLFAERARYRQSAFVLTEQNAPAVAEICHRLDGIPLAIELAAARVGLSAEQIAERLDNSLGLLTAGRRTAPPRHRTLRGTLDWSHKLLSKPERVLFRRLSVFAGGLTLEAAEAVGASDDIREDEVLDLLSRLVDKSLVVASATSGGEVRYRMLEPVRQYARERLEESRESQAIRRRHAAFFHALAEEAEPELTGVRQVAWLKRLGREHDNLRAALSWFLDPADEEQQERAELGLRLATALRWFWAVHGLSEGRGWLEKGLARSSTSPAPVRARALGEAGSIAIFQGDVGRAVALLEESLSLFRELEDKSGAASSLTNLGFALLNQDDKERVAALRQEAETLRREPLERPALAHLLLFFGAATMVAGDPEGASAPVEEALTLNRELGDTRGMTMSLTAQAINELARGDHERAESLFDNALRLLWEVEDKMGILHCLLGLAGVAGWRGRLARAARLWGAAEALHEATGVRMFPFVRRVYDYEGRVTTTRSLLDDEEAWAAAWSEGRAMSLEQAIEYALTEEEAAPAVTTSEQSSEDDSLTRREREVALLAARGLKDQQIAKELSISERTVSTHISRILRKLGLRSRAQITASMVEQQPPEDPGRKSPTS